MPSSARTAARSVSSATESAPPETAAASLMPGRNHSESPRILAKRRFISSERLPFFKGGLGRLHDRMKRQAVAATSRAQTDLCHLEAKRSWQSARRGPAIRKNAPGKEKGRLSRPLRLNCD